MKIYWCFGEVEVKLVRVEMLVLLRVMMVVMMSTRKQSCAPPSIPTAGELSSNLAAFVHVMQRHITY
jgi:hypothetical protein